jgi:hypothetical protein
MASVNCPTIDGLVAQTLRKRTYLFVELDVGWFEQLLLVFAQVADVLRMA